MQQNNILSLTANYLYEIHMAASSQLFQMMQSTPHFTLQQPYAQSSIIPNIEQHSYIIPTNINEDPNYSGSHTQSNQTNLIHVAERARPIRVVIIGNNKKLHLLSVKVMN
jgi:hypothetical protein